MNLPVILIDLHCFSLDIGVRFRKLEGTLVDAHSRRYSIVYPGLPFHADIRASELRKALSEMEPSVHLPMEDYE